MIKKSEYIIRDKNERVWFYFREKPDANV